MQQKYCIECGNRIIQGAKFCAFCGTRLLQIEETEPVFEPESTVDPGPVMEAESESDLEPEPIAEPNMPQHVRDERPQEFEPEPDFLPLGAEEHTIGFPVKPVMLPANGIVIKEGTMMMDADEMEKGVTRILDFGTGKRFEVVFPAGLQERDSIVITGTGLKDELTGADCDIKLMIINQ